MPITANIDSGYRFHEDKHIPHLPYRPKYGVPTRTLHRPVNHDTPDNLPGEIKALNAAGRAENYQRIAERRYRDVGQPFLCSAYDDPRKIQEEECKLDPNFYRDYKRTGPRLPYKMWPKKVEDYVQPKIEPEHYDTFVRQEGEYYRKIYNLTRNLHKVSSHLDTVQPRKPLKVKFDLEPEVYEPREELRRVKCLWKALEKVAFQKEKVYEGFPQIFKMAKPKTRVVNKKFGLPQPGSEFVDPSPAVPYVQDQPIVKQEAYIRYHKQDDDKECKENGPLLQLYNILTEEEKKDIRETCSYLFSSSFPCRLRDNRDFDFCPEDFIINICNTAKHEAVVAGHCRDFSNYWDTTSVKHYFDPRNLKKWVGDPKKSPEYFDANYENDHQIKRELNTDPTNEFNKFEPYCEVYYRKKDTEMKKKVLTPQVERRVKYKWAEPEDKPENLFEKEYKPMKSNTESKEKFSWPPNWYNGYFLKMILAIYRMVDFWNLVFQMEDPEQVWSKDECINLKTLPNRYEDAKKFDGKYTKACRLTVPRVIPRTERIPQICKTTVSPDNHTATSWLLRNCKRASTKRVQCNYMSQTKRDFLDESRLSMLREKHHNKKGLCMNDMLDDKKLFVKQK